LSVELYFDLVVVSRD